MARRFNLMHKIKHKTLFMVLLGLSTTPLFAAEGSADQWRFNADIYLYATPLSIELPNGIKNEVSFSDIMNNLDMVFMGGLGAHHGKWSFTTDLMYLNISDKINQPLLPGLELRQVGIESWIVSPMAAYEVFRNEKFTIDLTAGLRYLWIQVPTEFRTRAPLPDRQFSASPSGSNYDAAAGVHGRYEINDKWYATMYLDAGTGDSDYIWQTSATLGYRFKHLDAIAGYRYMFWELDNDRLQSLELKGPIAGISWKF